METIEERARDAASHTFIEDGEIVTYVNENEKDYYILGATEQKSIGDAELAEVKRQRDEYYDELLKLRQQKAIDIEKACEWLKKNTFLGTHPYELDEFRKAMEE